MKTTKRFLTIILVYLVTPMSSYAYLDPGTGSALIQLLLGGILTLGLTIKMYWYRLKRYLKGMFSKNGKK